MNYQFEHLMSSYKIGGATIKNRFCMGPMGGNGPYASNGAFTDQGCNYYIERAKGGFGLIFSGALTTDMEIDAYSERESISPMFSPRNFKRSAMQLNERISAYGAKMFPQITMGLGRNYPGLYAPSELPVYYAPNMTSPALTIDQIKKKTEFVIQAAVLMKSAGFAGVEVHAMHYGYLLDEFAMSITNHRTDEYGGNLENRMRVVKEIIEGIKQACGSNYPVTMRLGLKSYIKGLFQPSLNGEDEAGRTLEEGISICKMLESCGYDALNVDVGIYDSFYYAAPPMYMPKGFTLDLAKAAKAAVNIPVLAGGSRLGDPYMMEQALVERKADAFVIARASLADAYLPMKIQMGRPEKVRPCIGCNQGCFERALGQGGNACCAVNPVAGRESVYGITNAIQSKKVVVVGGGVSGMELARTATMRGHDVSLYEKNDKLGGHLHPGGSHTFKEDVKKLNEWYQRELKDMDVSVYTNMEVTPDMIKDMKADVVALTVGSVPIMPNLPGMDNPKVINCVDTLLGRKKIGKKVIIVGGGLVGCEIALECAKEGKVVTIVEALDSILSAREPVPIMNDLMLKDLLNHHKVEIITGHKLDSVNDAGVILVPTQGEKKTTEIIADSVVIAVGFKPVPSMASELYGLGAEIYEAGDGRHVGNIMKSIWDAYEIARSI